MNTARIMVRQMRLGELLKGEVFLPSSMDIELSGIELDSRRVEPGDLFLACKGNVHDGRDYIEEVIAKGAHAILVEKDHLYSEPKSQSGVPIVPVEKLSARISKLASRFFDYPARDMWLLGVTGTNGKTSCCQFVAQLYTAMGSKCGVSGTLGYGLYGNGALNLSAENVVAPGTTPDAITLQRIMEEVKIQGGSVMVMEVSSHGLIQKRVNIDEFNVAIFTNLSRDHLDYHGSMTAYGEAKRKLFSHHGLQVAVVNLDDIYSASILNSLGKRVKSYTYSLKNSHADIYAETLSHHPEGIAMKIATPWGKGEVQSSLLGSFNASNLLAALTAVLASESLKTTFNFSEILNLVNSITPVHGRMEVVGEENLKVVVDYAHTPDALKTALKALREHFSGKVWCVFGCGGNRDRGKRPLMAQVAETLADALVITDDNPRNEDSRQIIKQIMSGITQPNDVVVEPNREKAIAYAIEHAKEGDVVLIAGKGHEEYQDVGGNRMAFSDVKQARLCLNLRFVT